MHRRPTAFGCTTMRRLRVKSNPGNGLSEWCQLIHASRRAASDHVNQLIARHWDDRFNELLTPGSVATENSR